MASVLDPDAKDLVAKKTDDLVYFCPVLVCPDDCVGGKFVVFVGDVHPFL
jgi:hypothetical protein